MSAGFVDRQQVGRRFSRVAARYGEADFFAREVDRRMQERLDYVRIDPKAVLDLGAGTGGCAAALAGRYPNALLTLLDVTPTLLPPPPKLSPSAAFWQPGSAHASLFNSQT